MRRPVTAPQVSAVVPCRNASGTLVTCLAALREELRSRGEIIIVDDGSVDETVGLARMRADRVISSASHEGAARARNRGAAAAAASLILFVDADVVVRPGSVSALISAAESGWDACFGAYTPLPPPDCRNGPTLFKNLQQHYTHTRAPSPVRSFWSGFGIVRADAFTAVGGFDPAATHSADVEDVDLGYRLSAAGFRIRQEPTALAEHHKRYTLAAMVRSDVIHRAAPWVRTMVRTRRVHAELNLSPGPLVGALSLVAAIAALGRSALFGPSALRAVVAVGGLGAWAIVHAGFFRFAAHTAGARGLVVVPLQLLYGIYAPIGAVIGLAGAMADLITRRGASGGEHRFS